jgi:transposase
MRFWRSSPHWLNRSGIIYNSSQIQGSNRPVVGGVDTHKDLHIAAVVDDHDRVLDNQCFASTRQGYRKMLAWMQSFGEVTRVAYRNSRA